MINVKSVELENTEMEMQPPAVQTPAPRAGDADTRQRTFSNLGRLLKSSLGKKVELMPSLQQTEGVTRRGEAGKASK